MRNAFVDSVYELAAVDPRVNLIVGDLGFSVVERFAGDYPKQFLNAGVAEQNMAGVAAGMALSGRIVFIYSIANFPTMRCLEQIRNDICYHKVNVKIVSVGAGVAYGGLGMSHHATEDISVMRALPEMRVVVPADPIETKFATRAIAELDGPVYLRLGKAGETVIHNGDIKFEIGRAITVKNGADVAIIGSGSVLKECVEAAAELEQRKISARVISMHTIKPLDAETVRAAAKETKLVVSVEEHNTIGGLGGAISEVLSGMGCHAPLIKIGIPDTFCRIAGSRDYLRAQFGVNSNQIAAKIINFLLKNDGNT